MENVIKSIITGNDLESILENTLDSIYKNGPVSVTDMEILSYYTIYRPDVLDKSIDRLLIYMGMYYKVKQVTASSLKELVQLLYRDTIFEKSGAYYTPVQNSIISHINNNKCFSFSAPTSTGKSYVFRKLIESSSKDVVIFVPSRALINEYYLFLTEKITDKTVNILTFVEKINTTKAKRNIFILTPERSSDLFNIYKEFDVEFFLFDEAQLGEEKSTRGLYFDSVVRRVGKYYPQAKIIFAQPFVANPEAQLEKNHLDECSVSSCAYRQRNVGQIFYCYDKEKNVFSHIGVNHKVLGRRYSVDYDPVEKVLKKNGSVLFFVSKSNITSDRIYVKYKKYIDMCADLNDEIISSYHHRLHEYTGADANRNNTYYSESMALLKKGVVVHHGSLPLKARSIIEDFVKKGYARICFATSTMEQGINMPFDLVYIDRFEVSKPLAIKNLIGRAGRSTEERKLDVGSVVISSGNICDFRRIISTDYKLSKVSLLEDKCCELGDDFNDFRKSILDGTYIERFNMTQNQVESLSGYIVQNKVAELVDLLVSKNDEVLRLTKDQIKQYMASVILPNMVSIYECHLKRKTTDAEYEVLKNAIYILFSRMFNKSFSEICRKRYDYMCNVNTNNRIVGSGKVRFVMGYSDLPNKNLHKFALVDNDVSVKNVDYDIIIYDTYDYMDKLIGFKLADIYYAAFKLHNEKTNDKRSLIVANLMKYGTSDEKEINMIKYGMSLDDIHLLKPYIISIDSTGVSVLPEFYNLPDEQKKPLERFV